MSGPPDSRPPPVRRPGLAKVQPRREETVAVVRRAAQRWRMSERDLAQVLEVSKSRADAYLDAEAAFPLDALLALPERHALELLDDLRDLIRSRRRSA